MISAAKAIDTGESVAVKKVCVLQKDKVLMSRLQTSSPKES